jgi:hypothetical protein
MTEFSCTYGDDREEAIVTFLYDDADANLAERSRFETHVPTCARCQADLAALRGVRAQLTRWSPPEPSFALYNSQSSIANPQSLVRNPPWWSAMPAWAQVAAAALVLGVSAGIANLDVHYDRNGLNIRTGWSRGAVGSTSSGVSGEAGGSGQATAAQVAQTPSPADQPAPWRAELAALESQLKKEIRTAQPAPASRTVAATASDAEVTSRVRELLKESEKRQERELALRLAELAGDITAQRKADMVKIDRTLGLVQNNVGIEVMKTREKMNQMDLIYRASQQRQ